MRPERVLYIEGNEDGTVGGSHRQLYDLVKFLPRDRYEPVVLFYQDNVYRERLGEIGCRVLVFEDVRAQEYGVHTSGKKVAKTLQIFRSVATRRDFLKEERIDLVHINNTPRVGNDDWLPACRLLGIPIVASGMGDEFGEKDAVHRFLFKSFDRILPVSEHIQNAYRGLGVPDERMRMIHHGVDLETLKARVQRDPREVRREFGVGEDELLVAMVGNVREWKGQHVVVEALGLVSPRVRGRMRVIFAGAVREEDEGYFATLKRRISALGIDEVVSFVGSRNDIPDIFNAADLAIHSSVVPEPGGIVVLEALALGATVIAADRGGHVEALSGDRGRIFDTEKPEELADRIEELASDDALRKRLAENAQAEMEEFSIITHTARVTAVYDELLRGGA